MQDQTLTCKDCGKQFTWTAGEQEFYQQKGFAHPPARCPECRNKRKTEVRENRQMFTVTCANCGKEAQVPFEPKGNRPVYCADCFRQFKGQPQS